MIKKIISVFVCCAIVCGIVSGAAVAASEVTPVIIVPGYASAQLYLDYGTENEKVCWNLTADMVFGQMSKNIPGMTAALVETFLGNPYAIGYDIGEQGVLMLDELRCTPAGEDTCTLTTYPHDPAISNFKYVTENNVSLANFPESDYARYLSEKIGGENVFVYNTDFRHSVIDNVAQMRQFVLDVKEYSGSDKVNLFGLSYGGMMIGAYLSLYGTLGDVDNAVMSVPALGGTDIVVKTINADVDLTAKQLFEFLEAAVNPGTNAARLFDGMSPKVFNEIARGFLDGFRDTVLYWGSVWDFMPAEDYEAMKAKYLDPAESAQLIAKSDRMHYDIMANYNESFEACKRAGVNISILCNTGSTIALGGDKNADIVINSGSESGALCLPAGERFADGYVKQGGNCTNPDHRHVSPAMDIDASYAYLPDNTWFIDGQYHGMYFWEDYSRNLVTTLLLTDDITDVYSDPDYPQFEVSQHEYKGIYAKFNLSLSGCLDSKDTALTVHNLSKSHTIKLVSVTAEGLGDISFDIRSQRALKPGETAEIKFDGTVPAVSNTHASVTVNYIELGTLSPYGSRSFDFMVLNGESAPSLGNATVPDDVSPAQRIIPKPFYDILVRLGLRTAAEVICQTLCMVFAIMK